MANSAGTGGAGACSDSFIDGSANEGALSLVYQHDKGDAKKRPASPLMVSPVRAGQ